MGVNLGIDFGGSSIKAGLVDVAHGHIVGGTVAVPTPHPSTPHAVVEAIRALDAQLPHADAIGFGFPSVVKAGRACTAANIDAAWIGTDVGSLLREAFGRPAAFLNDADAAGLAEMRFGAGRGVSGTVLVFTFGTGIGSAPFIDGRLLPNTEFGHLEMRGGSAELWASARVRTELALGWAEWGARVSEYFAQMERLFWPDLMILCGGVSTHFDQFARYLETRAPVRPAALGAEAGIIGAALAAT
ncbi:MAG: Polyphosphate glucokinase [Steroidobacteraceae bacterium]|nr:Polyphosphate glucokinase [Steroidobacteraceae bacterium]